MKVATDESGFTVCVPNLTIPKERHFELALGRSNFWHLQLWFWKAGHNQLMVSYLQVKIMGQTEITTAPKLKFFQSFFSLEWNITDSFICSRNRIYSTPPKEWTWIRSLLSSILQSSGDRGMITKSNNYIRQFWPAIKNTV